MRKVEVKDGDSGYSLTNDQHAGLRLDVKGELTPALTRQLIDDLAPHAGVKKAKPKAAKPTPAAKPEGAS